MPVLIRAEGAASEMDGKAGKCSATEAMKKYLIDAEMVS